jgi:hypothetical protein
MARFTVRVELHDADWTKYEVLHKHMENAGFTRTIADAKGVLYHLPLAEYNYDGNATKEEVLEKAKACAARVVNDFEVLVTESNGRTWHNLKKV